MQAVTIRGAGGVEVLEIATVVTPQPGPGQVRVAVAAAGLNRADCLQRRGVYPPPADSPADIPGLEFAGTIDVVGDGARWAVGDRVMGICGGGAMATHVIAHERTIARAPHNLTLEQAAAIPEVFLTAYDAMMIQGGLGVGQTVLIHAVGSGVGTAAVQLARATGATSIGTSRTADKLERCKPLGLDVGLVADDGMSTELRPDLIVDLIGAKYLDFDVRTIKPGGHIIVVGLLGGARAQLDLGLLLRKRISITGTVLRSRPLEEKALLTQQFASHVVGMFESGALAPIIEDVMPMSKIRDAHTRMESNEMFGKLVLSWDS
jgi:putative PIG3 family NAD(P)H quinone oxidoreductase